MLFLEVTGFDCGGADVLRIIKFIFNLLDVVLFIIPMILIVMVSIDMVKNVISVKDDVAKKNLGIGIKRIIFCIALFLIDSIVYTAIGLLGKSEYLSYAQCVEIAKTHDLSNYEIDYEEDTYDDVKTPNFSD